mmetsp:Transcript_19795/g.25649  ORF Transcript_19795/g.25649 Transcript_19795/m.25649 type:complete len:88 (+) Transcript_19795:118-381(+)
MAVKKDPLPEPREADQEEESQTTWLPFDLDESGKLPVQVFLDKIRSSGISLQDQRVLPDLKHILAESHKLIGYEEGKCSYVYRSWKY